MKCIGSGDPWMATRIAADIEELGYGGSRVVLKAIQEVAIADVQKQVVAVRQGETVQRIAYFVTFFFKKKYIYIYIYILTCLLAY